MERITTVLVLLIMREGTGTSSGEVTFENPDPCALKGSSVEFKCSYRYNEGETVRKTLWYKGDFLGDIWTRIKLSDLPSYENRIEYLGDQKHNCSIAIHDVQENDTGHYYFRFDTEKFGYRSKKSVQLSVTELSASMYPDRVRAGEDVKLECKTSCQQLPSIIWFKDGRPVAKPVFQAQAEDSGNYSCAIEGQESDKSDPVILIVQYAPLNVSIEMGRPGLMVEGSNVSLTCTANPAADSYTWYKDFSGSMLQVGSGQVLSLPSVNVSHSGLYLCRVRNSMGEGNSMGVLLTVYGTDINHLILRVGFGVKVVIVLLLTMIIIWACKKMRVSPVDKMVRRSLLCLNGSTTVCHKRYNVFLIFCFRSTAMHFWLNKLQKLNRTDKGIVLLPDLYLPTFVLIVVVTILFFI
ncbi:B-cell receptor CD22-like isoform X2 [Hippoglossus hippoglossus]|uniref:B-cell receptor CD22-like isoform X2 n=1 Tax=Hippoglossus hippoglossus TaxID=8267 RepID=UPI00148DAF85|nr:B-cell receptor CD22-like isoform X2 [Hippoglossus hippoglossus]